MVTKNAVFMRSVAFRKRLNDICKQEVTQAGKEIYILYVKDTFQVKIWECPFCVWQWSKIRIRLIAL